MGKVAHHPRPPVTCSSENLAMKLRFLLTSVCVGEWSSSSLSFCSWPGRHTGTHKIQAQPGQGAPSGSCNCFSNNPPGPSQSAPLHAASPQHTAHPPAQHPSSQKAQLALPSRDTRPHPVSYHRSSYRGRARVCSGHGPSHAAGAHSCRSGVPPRSTRCSRGSPGTAAPRPPPAAESPSPGGAPRSAGEEKWGGCEGGPGSAWPRGTPPRSLGQQLTRAAGSPLGSVTVGFGSEQSQRALTTPATRHSVPPGRTVGGGINRP